MTHPQLSPEQVFHEARAIESPSERDGYLRGACGNDVALRSKVEALLQADAEAGSFLASAGNEGDATVVTAPREQAGAMIGRYKLLQPIGEGGFGVVWMAEQKKPVKRRVALKIIKLGMDTKQVIARFEAERQALAMMAHPNIATVLDAGATETGRPYFVMELVKGIPITEYCDQNNLTVHARLDLFKLVCAAVQHAHQKGIIHRDIKPSNVLVTLHDGQPVPKVIDFGIAKATNAELTEKTLFTEHRQMVGTPQYMSPEQAEMSGLDIDTRSDIYALGVLLYELLTGTTPFDPKRLRSAGLNEIQRIIREEEPHKPSTRLSTLDTLESIAAHRNIEPRKLGLQIRGDLDWIIMKALEKDRTRRYDTAEGFAADVQRHLDDEPVVAGPPSAGYRLRKFVRRNRTGVMTALVVVAVSVIGALVSINYAIGEAHQRQIADQKTIEAEDNLELAREQERAANASRDEAEKQERQAEEAAQRARWQSYLANVRGAQASLHSNDVRNAGVLLDQAPSELRRWEWLYLHAQVHQSQAVLRGHGSGAFAVTFSSDGTRIASGGGSYQWGRESKDNTVRLWDASTGDELDVLRGHEDTVFSVAFSPDGTRIVSGSRDNRLRVWDTASGKELLVLRGHKQPVYSVAFSPDGSRIVSGSNDRTVRVWDASSGEELLVLRGHEDLVWSVAFSPNGSRIASGSGPWFEGAAAVRVWDASTGKELRVLRGHKGRVTSVAFSPDGTRIASGSYDKTVRVWDTSSGDALLVLRGQKAFNSVAFSPDGTRIATGSDDRTVRLWDAASGKELAVLREHESGVLSVAFSPRGSRIASGSGDGTVRLWDASIPGAFAVLLGHETGRPHADRPGALWPVGVNSVAFSPDGTRIATGSNDRTVRLWDVVAGEQLLVLRGHGNSVGSVAFSPDGSRIASAAADDTVRLWDALAGKQLLVIRGLEDPVHSLAFSPDGSRIAAGSGPWGDEGAGTVLVWDASSGEELLVLRGHEEPVYSVAFSPDGSRIASGGGSYEYGRESKDNTVRLWDASTGDELNVLRGHEDTVFSVAFSPDGLRIVTASKDNTARVWDTASGKELAVFRRHEGTVFSASFSPDGSRIASGSRDTTVRLWDASTADELLVLRADQDIVNTVVFSPDGSRIACAFENDGAVRLWDTIAYRDRVAERDDAHRAEQTISPFVDVLFGKGLDCSAVADQVGSDPSLSDSLRHAAINLVLKRCSVIHEEARSLVRDLETQLVFAAEIQAAVQENTSLEPAVRAAAIDIAHWIEDNPVRLSRRAWRIVKDDDRSPADYEQAKRAAASAFQDDSTSQHFARTLAKAWTRLHQPDKALEVWREHVDQLRSATPADDLGLTNTLIEYAKALLKNNQAADAEPVLRECLSIVEKLVANTELRFHRTEETRRMLGECLATQGADPSLSAAVRTKKFTEAETILIELANSVQEDDTASKDDRNEAIQRVVDLYEAWHAAEPGQGYDAKAAQWRAKLPQSPDRSGQEEEGDD